MNKINVNNNWDRLEEIWLGDTWPQHFYDDMSSEVRDTFCKLTEWTQEDLKIITKKFNKFGVTVHRPKINPNADQYKVEKNNALRLLKPPICPRDYFGVIGNKLYTHRGEQHGVWDWLFDYYDSNCISEKYNISGANIVKLGRDIIFDHALGDYWAVTDDVLKLRLFECYKKFAKTIIPEFEKDYRIHFSATGGHLDGQFMPVRPGLVLATNYWSDYDLVMPNWEKIIISQPTWLSEGKEYKSNLINDSKNNYAWYLVEPGDTSQKQAHFNNYVAEFCSEWIGNYKETYFEVNIIMLDENNMMCIDTAANHDPLFEHFSKLGINVHVVPWRSRAFWDGGLHCITLDTRRKSKGIVDLFPERGPNGLNSILHTLFDNSQELFYNEYNEWLKTTE